MNSSCQFPIDFVFLWCDGSDLEFSRQKLTRMKQCPPPLVDENMGDIRYIQYDELRYALRSIYTYAPWFRHIFIVTNNQRPSWLTDHPKISLVDHTEIIPLRLLPTFSSIGIEMYLDKIPKLSEHFVYANDDTMLNRPLEPSDFFLKDGRPIVWLARGKLEKITPYIASRLLNSSFISNWQKSIIRAWELFRKKSGKQILFHQPAHSFDAYTKDFFKETLKKHPELYVANSAPFRSKESISRVLFSYEMINTFGCPCVFRNKTNFWARIKKCFAPVETVAISGGCESIRKTIRKIELFNPKTVCFNNLTSNSADEAIAYLKKRFPTPAPWEKF